MNISCENVRALLTSYLDAELSEEQASPVRAHLLDCCGCRESVQEGKVVRRWFAFAADDQAVVPQGFAARVARRAFAGDVGLLNPAARADERAPLLPFLLRLTAVAAGLLFCFSLFVRNASLPQGSDVDAEVRSFWLTEEEDVPAPVDPVSGTRDAADNDLDEATNEPDEETEDDSSEGR